jgi:hypothetical protein
MAGTSPAMTTCENEMPSTAMSAVIVMSAVIAVQHYRDVQRNRDVHRRGSSDLKSILFNFVHDLASGSVSSRHDV